MLHLPGLDPLGCKVIGQKAQIGPRDDQDGQCLDIVDRGRRLAHAQAVQVILLHEPPGHDAAVGDVLQQLLALCRAAEQGVAAPAIQPQGLLVQRRVFKARDGAGEMPDGQVQAAVQNPLFQFGRGADIHIEVYVVAPGHKALRGSRQGRAGVADGGVDNAQVKHAGDVLFEHPGIQAKGVHGLQQAQGRFVNGHPLFGQAKAAAAALAQLYPEPGFEVGHVFADGRLADVQGRLRR